MLSTSWIQITRHSCCYPSCSRRAYLLKSGAVLAHDDRDNEHAAGSEHRSAGAEPQLADKHEGAVIAVGSCPARMAFDNAKSSESASAPRFRPRSVTPADGSHSLQNARAESINVTAIRARRRPPRGRGSRASE